MASAVTVSRRASDNLNGRADASRQVEAGVYPHVCGATAIAIVGPLTLLAHTKSYLPPWGRV